MSDHDMMEHEAPDSSNKESGKEQRWVGILRSRYFAMGVAAAVLLVGFLLARKFGIGGRVLPIVGLAAFMMFSRSFMHGGHGSRGGHGGCGSSTRRSSEIGSAQSGDVEPESGKDDQQRSPRSHSGCH
jgi:hypothetical protein